MFIYICTYKNILYTYIHIYIYKVKYVSTACVIQYMAHMPYINISIGIIRILHISYVHWFSMLDFPLPTKKLRVPLPDV